MVVDGLKDAGFWIFEPVGHQRDRGLADGKVAGGRDGDGALARHLEAVKLLEGGDIVETRIGAGIGHHDQPFVHQQSDAIGHSPMSPDVKAVRMAALAADPVKAQ